MIINYLKQLISIIMILIKIKQKSQNNKNKKIFKALWYSLIPMMMHLNLKMYKHKIQTRIGFRSVSNIMTRMERLSLSKPKMKRAY